MSDAFKKILDATPAYVQIRYASSEHDPADVDMLKLPTRASLVIAFGEPGFGFGELTFVQDDTGQLFLDTEHTNKKTVKEFLSKWVDSAFLDTEDDPMKHARYNEVRKRTCGASCRICHPD